MENENLKLVQSNNELNEQINALNDKLQISDNQIGSVKTTLAMLESEFGSYKEKAKSILKQKDDLITSLQEGTTNRSSITSDVDNSFLSEINALK